MIHGDLKRVAPCHLSCYTDHVEVGPVVPPGDELTYAALGLVPAETLGHDMESRVDELKARLHAQMRASVANAPNREVADTVDPIVVVPAGRYPARGLHAVVVRCRSCGRWLAVNPQVANTKYCSHQCFRFGRSAAERERRRRAREGGIRPGPRCRHCGGLFEAKRADAKYCSGRCRTAASRSR